MGKKQRKLPFMKWYWGDWKKDAGVQALNYHRRGVWHAMLGLMFESDRRGYLVLNGEAYPSDLLATALNLPESEVLELLTLFKKIGLCSVEEETGILYNRRMVRDAEADEGNEGENRGEEGEKRGNPSLTGNYACPGFIIAYQRASDSLIKIGISTNPTKRLYRLRENSPDDKITILETFTVLDMAAAKEIMLAFYDSRSKNGWMKLTAAEAKDVFSPLRGTMRGTGGVPPQGTTKPEVRGQKSEKKKEEDGAAEIPSDWQPSEELIAWAADKTPTIDPGRCAEHFKIHFRKKDTKNRLRADWDSEFKIWILREAGDPDSPYLKTKSGNGADSAPQTYRGMPIGEIG